MKNKLKILVVDDEVDVLNTMTLMLETADDGHEIIPANSGAQALSYIQKHPDLDIIISDINMDGINGLQLAKMVKDINPTIRIILISGFISIIDQIKHFQMGIEKILNKPFTIDELTYIIDNPTDITPLPSTSMVPVKVDSLLHVPSLSIDLYVQLTEEKFIKIFHAKQKIDHNRLNHFIEQQVVFLYAKKDDYFNLNFVFYLPTRVSTLKTKRELNFDVYYLQGEEYKKLIPSGSIMNQEMLSIIKERKIKVLYITDKDNALFLDYLDETLSDYMISKENTVEDKLMASSELVQSRVQEVYLNPTNENIIALKTSQKHLMEFLKINNESIKDLLLINEKDQRLHVHSSMVASLSYAVLLKIISMRKHKEEKLKIRALDEYIFETDELKEIIFTGALLHDIGRSLSSEVLETSATNHPLLAYNKLESLNGLHAKSLEIILQHEEYCDGFGYPNKLRKTNISFFAQVVMLVNHFDKLRRNEKLEIKDALNEIKKTPDKFNKHLIPILELVVAS